MKISQVYLLNTVIALVYSLLLLLFPTMMLNAHGMAVSESAVLMGRYFGVALLGMGLATWLARNALPSSAKSAITLGYLISDIAGLIVSLMAVISGQMNALGWLAVVIYVVLTAGFGYFQFMAGEE